MILLKKLPKSYKELSFKKYVKILQAIPDEKPASWSAEEWSAELHLNTLSILLDEPIGVLETLQASEILELIKAIGYLDKPIEEDKNTPYKVKRVDELTYDNFASYQRLRLDQWDNLDTILLTVIVGATPESVENMSIYDAVQVFFCLKKETSRYLKCLKYSTARRAIYQTLKALCKRIVTSKSKSLDRVGVGLT